MKGIIKIIVPDRARCPTCKGRKYIIFRKKKEECPSCSGSGYISNQIWAWSRQSRLAGLNKEEEAMSAEEYINKLIEQRMNKEVYNKMLELDSMNIPDGEKILLFMKWINSKENKIRWLYPKDKAITIDEINKIIFNILLNGGEDDEGQPAKK